MGNFVLSPQALEDLDIIWLHIAHDNPDAADRVIEAAYRICKSLAEHPELGPVRQFPGNIPAGIRFFVIPDFPNYIIFYRAADDGVEIVRILHGAKNIDDIFSG